MPDEIRGQYFNMVLVIGPEMLRPRLLAFSSTCYRTSDIRLFTHFTSPLLEFCLIMMHFCIEKAQKIHQDFSNNPVHLVSSLTKDLLIPLKERIT